MTEVEGTNVSSHKRPSRSSSPIREMDGNARTQRFRTVTAAIWKGDDITAPEDKAQIATQTSISSRTDAARANGPSDSDGFPFPAKAGKGGENSTHVIARAHPQLASTGFSAPNKIQRASTGGPTTSATPVLAGGNNTSGRPSIQFAEASTASNSSFPSQVPNGSLVNSSNERPSHFRSTSLISKIRALTPSSHVRSQSGFIGSSAKISEDGTASRQGVTPEGRAGEGDEDGDIEDNGSEGPAFALSKRLKRGKELVSGSDANEPPENPTKVDDLRKGTTNTASRPRSRFSVRRAATTTDMTENQRQGLSEDEGRDRLARNAGWKRKGSAWLQGGQQSGNSSPRRLSAQDSESTRPRNRRFFTTLAGNSSIPDGTSSQRKVRGETRAHEKWQKFRSSLKLMVQKTREERLNEAKSAELVAELLAGTPAALILASSFQRDERDKKKIPVLLEQLKIDITRSSSTKDDAGADRHYLFHLELEYGSGLMRMKWTVDRTLRDFVNLHLKYKLQSSTRQYIQRRGTDDSARPKLPSFPKGAFPILRGVRGFADDEEEEETAEEGEGADENARSVEKLAKGKRRPSSIKAPRRQSSVADVENANTVSPPGRSTTDADMSNSSEPKKESKESYQARQRKKLEAYLRDLVRFVTFRTGSNRLCRFLELSALGVRLASESTFHGKEGTLVLQSGKGIDFRKAWKPSLLIQRHRPMWFLVRHSYLVYVNSPEEMNVYDVFLIDSAFNIQAKRPRLRDQKNVQDLTRTAKTQARHPQHHVLRLQNSERKIKLLAKNERQLQQFEDSLRFVRATTDWARTNRFDSFAPVRTNVFAQWLVDGRDYMWNLSRAISMAQDVIYIHDWWLSPELYTRRPAAISHKWRLDRLLQRKAKEGVKIFVIVYRNINSAIPIDSEYTKFSLLELHPNVFVQRSPNQLRQNTFFWAHHEKICIVDHTIAFCGGVDLCYGRWDTPQHTVVDDKPTGFEPTNMPLDADHCQLWPGKDYSNPRILDFFKLDEPYGEMYDRAKVPRMPWHDIGMQIVGQPARDLTRHFVQRWNYILRQRKPSRPTPFLLPPPDFGPNETEALGLDGTCNIQILRSACDWSIGTPHKIEHSIMNAYVKLIQTSNHLVYIENQFFISSCVVEGTRIRNSIGDALVERVIRAHAARENWLAIIVIPLMPGFQNTVDAQDGTSIRLIMQCQYRSIDRGDTSIFGRLRAVGIEPEDYIRFYSLRSWGKIGPTKALVTEQLYIHAKCMVVDDRYAIIGSANINERSLLGDRDSEVAAVIYDTDMIDSFMAGQGYRVGRFPHTLRMRLMREHLGLDVDEVMSEERSEKFFAEEGSSLDGEDVGRTSLNSNRSMERKLVAVRHQHQDDMIFKSENMRSFNHDFDWEQANNPNLKTNKKLTSDPRITGNKEHKADVDGFGFDKMAQQVGRPAAKGRDTVLLRGDREVLMSNMSPEGKGTLSSPVNPAVKHNKHSNSQDDDDSATTIAVFPPPRPPRLHTQELGLTLVSQLPPLPAGDDTDIGGPPLQRTFSHASAELFNPLLATMRRPVVDKDCMRDPLNDSFFHDTWHAVAQNNTKIYRQVFKCMPDSQVTNWKEYEAAVDYAERFAQSQGMPKSNIKMQQDSQGKTGPPGHGASVLSQPLTGVKSKLENTSATADTTQSDITQKLTALLDRREEPRLHRSWSLSRDGQQQQNDEEDAVREKDYSLHQKEQLKSADTPSLRVDFASTPTKEGLDGADGLSEKPQAWNGDVQSPESQNCGTRRQRRATTKSSVHGPDHMPNKADSEELLKLIQGHLVEWPYDWLIQEERGGKWLYSVDQMAPLEIYN